MSTSPATATGGERVGSAGGGGNRLTQTTPAVVARGAIPSRSRSEGLSNEVLGFAGPRRPPGRARPSSDRVSVRGLSSTLPFASALAPIVTRSGMPMRSASLNFTPGARRDRPRGPRRRPPRAPRAGVVAVRRSPRRRAELHEVHVVRRDAHRPTRCRCRRGAARPSSRRGARRRCRSSP